MPRKTGQKKQTKIIKVIEVPQITYTSVTYSNGNTPPLTVLKNLKLEVFRDSDQEFSKYLQYLLNFYVHCSVTLIYKCVKTTSGLNKLLSGLSINTLGMNVSRTVWHRSLNDKQIANLTTRFISN